MDKYITIKGKRDRLQIILDDELNFDKLKDELKKKILPMKTLLKNANIAIEFLNRELTLMEEDQLIDIIKKYSDITITMIFSKHVYSHDETLTQRLIDNSTSESTEEIGENLTTTKPFLSDFNVALEGNTKFHKGNLRSGRKLEFDGNIVVLGDVNPGATVKSSGNVIVLGYLNGTVNAGKKDSKNSFVGAIFMNPVHLTIGEIKSNPMQREILETNKVNKRNKFKIAFLKNGEIQIEDFNIRSFL
ncbi:septum site-determining protein MinC [Fusobacterium sp. PH5-44]|uniref:septum site-determining protein MinC n=1 Tax=unclassified Fusobacterium TaxID=2648384 RepID=UPI003D2356DA